MAGFGTVGVGVEADCGVSWATKHSPCAIICVVAGWLPEDLVEGGIKRLLFLARENPATRLLVLDVSMRKEWIREDADTPLPVDFLQKLSKDRRENVRVSIMEATTEPSPAIPGMSVQNLPTTMVFQGGKVACEGVVQGFTKKDMQTVEALVRQSSTQGSTRLDTTSLFSQAEAPKELNKLGSAAPLSLPHGIEMCPSTAAAMFGEALTRLYGIESILTPADSSGAGSCAVLAEDLEGLEAQINKAETDAQDMRSVGTEKGAVKASRAKRLHESGVNTAQVCAVAEGLLDVCNAHATMQGHLHGDIRRSLSLLDTQANWIREDIALLRGITMRDARGRSPVKVSPLAKCIRSTHTPSQSMASRPASLAWYVPGRSGGNLWDGQGDVSVIGQNNQGSSRRTLLSHTQSSAHMPESVRSAGTGQSPSTQKVDGWRRGASSVKEVLKMVGNMRVGSSPLGPSQRNVQM